MKNSWKKVVAMMIAAALCVSCGVTGFSEDIQTDESTEIVEVVEAQNQEEPQQEEAPAQEPVPEPEPAPVKEPDPAPVQEPEPVKEPEPAPEAPKAEPAPVTEEPKNEPEAPKAEPAPVTEEQKKEEEIKADEKTEENIEEKTEVPEQKIEESAEQKKEDIKADESKKEEEIKAETQIEESKEESKTEEPKAEESKEEPKAEEKPAEQPTVPAAKAEQPVEDAPAADVVVKENITVCIEWEDEDDALGLRPQTRAVTLNGSDGQTYSATLAEKDGWQHTFADLTTQRGAEVIYYSVDADDVTDYDKDVRGLTVTYTCTAKPVVDEPPVAEDENLIDDQMDGEQGELPEGDGPTVTETEDGTVIEHSHDHAHGHHHTNTKAVLNRLSRAIGHMESIKRMVEEGRDCTEVLIQLSAVKAAINNTGKIILEDHIEHCIVDAVEHGDTKAIQELNKAIDRFVK